MTHLKQHLIPVIRVREFFFYTFDEIKMIKKMFLMHVNDALKATLLQHSCLIPVIRERDAKHEDSMDSQGGLEEAKDA